MSYLRLWRASAARFQRRLVVRLRFWYSDISGGLLGLGAGV
jgi:hypothetical protein